ncbi:MAG: PSD1 domain-containing protein [Planctomycetales bacterium]|nr:PSD1 domain-containing protein [Planctomycetales bacterium]
MKPPYCPLTFFVLLVGSVAPGSERPIDFNQDIRPLFAAKCFVCHGPDQEHRESDLRLDVRQEAINYGAIEPGNADDSLFIQRILSDDPDEVMPPPHANDVLTDQQKQLFVQWVNQGAPYAEHWAFVPPVKSALPQIQNATWPRNDIDYFVLARLEAQNLKPAPEADRYALVRRVYLDLIGLPPTPEQADAFVEDTDPLAYENLVDQLLQSEHYGERWARQWLDLARYSDTNGYEKDRERSIWPYRDWVIRALNNDMPFNQFTVEQIAGDMLPNPTEDQKIATGFQWNTMINEEGGIDPLEYRFYAMVDRVATTGSVWLGLSTGCAQCHTHKYDPITHTDYYSLFALLNNADEPDLVVKPADIAARRQELENQIAKLEAELPGHFPPREGGGTEFERRRDHLDAKFNEWCESARGEATEWTTLVPAEMSTNSPRLEVLENGSIFSTGDITKRDVFQLRFHLPDDSVPITAIRLEVLPDDRLPARGPGRAYYEGRKGDFFLSEFDGRWNGEAIEFASPSRSYGKIAVGSGDGNAENVLDGDGSTGWSTAEREGEAHQLVLNLPVPINHGGELEIELLFERHFAASLGRFRFSATSSERLAKASQLPVQIEALLTKPESAWTVQQRQRVLAYYLSVAPELADARQPIDALRAQLPAFPTTMVMHERPIDNPRPTARHHRGEYLSPKEDVSPAIPAFLADLDATQPTNRLEFAQWLVSDGNPLVGRVTVNRAWQAMFGKGLLRTSDDFGTQADLPTHPQLLDWLACEFIERGWSLKGLHRLIVTSATYRQSSLVTPELLQRDPENDLLARGPRFRLPAEIVRDVMLSGCGLLSDKMYGPGVHPPQPQSVTAVAYGNPPWDASTGDDRYRRSLYTFSKRTAPFAAYVVFDAPTGETCVARRDRSNTPLQALTMLNDGMFLEMSRALAKQAVSRGKPVDETAAWIFRRLLTRPPEKDELHVIAEYYRSQFDRLAKDELPSRPITGDDAGTQQQAAWTMVARSLMNLDEAISKP